MISVCIATYNGEKYIYDQLKSILCQLGELDEVIVSDDGSVDDTLKIISQFNDPRIKVVQGPCKGYIQNFSNAILNSKGNFIFLSDQDDIWCKNKVEKMLPLLKSKKLVLHNATLINGDGMSLNEHLFLSFVHFSFWKNLIKHQTYGCCLAFDSCIKKYIVPIPENKHLLHETWISAMTQLAYGNSSLLYIDSPLILYRRHGNNVSVFRNSNRSLFVRVEERCSLLFFLVIRYLKVRFNL